MNDALYLKRLKAAVAMGHRKSGSFAKRPKTTRPSSRDLLEEVDQELWDSIPKNADCPLCNGATNIKVPGGWTSCECFEARRSEYFRTLGERN